MSIPWPFHNKLVQVTTLVATLLIPITLLALSRTIKTLARILHNKLQQHRKFQQVPGIYPTVYSEYCTCHSSSDTRVEREGEDCIQPERMELYIAEKYQRIQEQNRSPKPQVRRRFRLELKPNRNQPLVASRPAEQISNPAKVCNAERTSEKRGKESAMSFNAHKNLKPASLKRNGSQFPKDQGTATDRIPSEGNVVVTIRNKPIHQKQNSPAKTMLEKKLEQELKQVESVELRKGSSVKNASGHVKDNGECASKPNGTSATDTSVDLQPKAHEHEKPRRTSTRKTSVRNRSSPESQPSTVKISPSSSRESFSTACCSSTASSSDPSDSETDSSSSQTKTEDYSSSQTTQTTDNEEPQCDENTKLCEHQNVRSSGNDFGKIPSPTQAFATSELDFRSDISQKSRSEDDQLSTNFEDLRNLKGNVTFSDWLKATLKTWFPARSRVPCDREKTHRDGTEHFHEYDIRNMIDPQKSGLWDSDHTPMATTYKACPHSCESSFCNFRSTLESWKKELLALQDSLEESKNVMPANTCAFCHTDHGSTGSTNCYAMQIAQEFWRMIIEFKKIHHRSCDCPCVSERRFGYRKYQAEQCSLGHWHTCRNDFSGCSQKRNSPGVDDMREAPCVHVLLDELERLQDKVRKSKESENNTDETLSRNEKAGHGKNGPVLSRSYTINSSMYTSVDPGQSIDSKQHAPIMVTRQHQNGNGLTCNAQSHFSGDMSKAVAGDRGVDLLEDHTKPFPPIEKTSIDRLACEEKDSQREESSTSNVLPSPPSVYLTTDISEMEDLSDFFLGKGKISTDRRNNEKLTDHILSSECLAGEAEVHAQDSENLSAILMQNKPLSIQNKRLSEPATLRCPSPTPACDGDSLKPLLRMDQKRADHKPLLSHETGDSTHQKESITRSKHEQESIDLTSAFDSLIADLVQYQQNQCGRSAEKIENKSPKNVQFSLSPTHRTDSIISASSSREASPAVRSAIPIRSIWSSPKTNVQRQHMQCVENPHVTKAFGQLNNVLDELRQLMDGP